MVWSPDTPQGDETAKIRWELVPYTRGRVLNLGAGNTRGFPHFITVDNRADVELFGTKDLNPDIIADCTDLSLFASQSCDAVFSSHLLEHIEDTRATLKEWWRVIRPGGHLCLYLPHRAFYPNIGQPGSNPDHKHDFLPSDIIETMRGLGAWDLLENQERNGGIEYSFFQVFRKRTDGKHLESWRAPKPAKTACVARYGAYGDLLMASSVFAGLKAQGFHVTLMCSPPGMDAVLHDPNVDRFWIQDKDQVPNMWLSPYFDYWSKRFDRFVNLCESLEGALLALPDRPFYDWPHAARHAHMNRNYLETQHALAQVPHVPAVKFYPTPEEQAWARKERAKLGVGPVVLWSLSGSSVHKYWSGLDAILARILLIYPTARVVLCGGPECTLLESGWQNEPRVIRTCGKWSIRQSLSFIPESDLVIGPETGVLNAASCEPVPKIVFLSHSSSENLTRDWTNRTTLVPPPGTTPCYPCHMLHYGWSHCHRDESTSSALCQANITPDAVWAAIQSVLDQRLKRSA